MSDEQPDHRSLVHAAYEVLDGVAERISLSFAIYERGSLWPRLYRDADAESLCGFARRSGPMSGRCRDEEAAMARAAFETGKPQSGVCWQGTLRRVIPVPSGPDPAIAVALCGFGVDPEAAEQDYLPAEIAAALGFPEKTRGDAFGRDSGLSIGPAEVTFDLLGRVLEGLSRHQAPDPQDR